MVNLTIVVMIMVIIIVTKMMVIVTAVTKMVTQEDGNLSETFTPLFCTLPSLVCSVRSRPVHSSFRVLLKLGTVRTCELCRRHDIDGGRI